MSRAVSPDIWRDDWFGQLDHTHRLMWIGLVTCCADDQGRIINNALLVRADLFPYDENITDVIVRQALESFAAAGKLWAYNANGKSILQIVNWWKYQSSAAWMAASRLPAPEGWVDRCRYHGQQKKIIESNWDKTGGFVELPSALLSALGRAREEVKDEVKVKDDGDDEVEGEAKSPPEKQMTSSTENPPANLEVEPETEHANISVESENKTTKIKCGYTNLDLMQVASAWQKYLSEINSERKIPLTMRTWIETTTPIQVENLSDAVVVTVHAESAEAATVLQSKFAATAERALPGWIMSPVPKYIVKFVNGAK